MRINEVAKKAALRRMTLLSFVITAGLLCNYANGILVPISHYQNLFEWLRINGANLHGVRIAHFENHGWGLARNYNSSSAEPGTFEYNINFQISSFQALVAPGPTPAILGLAERKEDAKDRKIDYSKISTTICFDEGKCVSVKDSQLLVVTYVACERAKGYGSLWYPYLDSIITPATPTYSILLAILGGPASKVRVWKRKEDEIPSEHQISFEWAEAGSPRPAEKINLIEIAEGIREAYAPSDYASRLLEHAIEKELRIGTVLSSAIRRVGNSLNELGSDYSPILEYDDLEVRRMIAWASQITGSRGAHFQDIGFALLPLWDLMNHGSSKDILNWENYIKVKNGSLVFANPPKLNADENEELLHDYGFPSTCAMNWVLQYGFIPENIIAPIKQSNNYNNEDATTIIAGCSDILIAGERHVIAAANVKNSNKVSLLRMEQLQAAAEAAWSESYSSGRGKHPALRLADMLSSHADRLPPDDVLRAQMDSSTMSMRAGLGLDEVHVARYHAAVVMLLERRALLGAKATVLERVNVTAKFTCHADRHSII